MSRLSTTHNAYLAQAWWVSVNEKTTSFRGWWEGNKGAVVIGSMTAASIWLKPEQHCYFLGGVAGRQQRSRHGLYDKPILGHPDAFRTPGCKGRDFIASSWRLVVEPAATPVIFSPGRSTGASDGPYTQVPSTFGFVQWKVGTSGPPKVPPPRPPQWICTQSGGGALETVSQNLWCWAICHSTDAH